jgi:hypothetical protein
MFVEGTARGLLDLNRSNVLKQIPGHERNYVPLRVMPRSLLNCESATALS